LVFAAMADKNIPSMLAVLVPHVSAIVLTRAATPRSADPHLLAKMLAETTTTTAGPTVVIQPDLRLALDAARRLGRHLAVAGSIFLLGDVMTLLADRADQNAGT
jgi:folylpolyglutamate synthase/dihydropteroate synthase